MKLLFNPGYSVYLDVTPTLLEQLLKCSIYEQYYEGGYKYRGKTEASPDLRLVSENEITDKEVQTIDIEFIMEENNRLTRELDKLKEKLKPVSVSTELETIE